MLNPTVDGNFLKVSSNVVNGAWILVPLKFALKPFSL